MENIPIPVNDELFTVYGSKSCPFCLRAKSLLESNNIRFTYHDIEQYGTRKDFFIYFRSLNKLGPLVRTIPVIFNNGIYIGGYTNLEQKLSLALCNDF